VEDLAALQALKSLRILELSRARPWKPARLEALFDLPLEYLGLEGSLIDDVSPLRQLPRLSRLEISRTRVRDLSPLRGAALTSLLCIGTPLRDGAALCEVLKSMKSLETFNGKPPAEFCGDSAAVAELEEMLQQLVASNPAYDRLVVRRKLENGHVTDLTLDDNALSNFSALQKLPALTSLSLRRASPWHATNWNFLKGMKLLSLDLRGGQIADLTPLKGMPLEQLDVSHAGQIKDLSPLEESLLKSLTIHGGEQLKDLTSLAKVPLVDLVFDHIDASRDAPVLKSIKTLKTINRRPVAEFWKETDAQSN
jgi:Leucine-rich repeat (LRR) protein